MREFNINEFNKKIEEQRPSITKTLLKDNQIGKIKNRQRDDDEIKILNLISKSRWQKAVAEGKVKKIAKNVYTYYFD